MLVTFELKGFSAFVKHWEALSIHTEKHITIEAHGGVMYGKYLGVTDLGYLRIMCNEAEERLPSGHVLEW